MVALRHLDRLLDIDQALCDKPDDWTNHRNDAEPCQEQSIRIGVQDSDAMRPSWVAHNAFLGGSSPRLREIGLHGVALPSSESSFVHQQPRRFSPFQHP
jgi:hypothetical protein